MPDREKVIRAWECCNPFNRKCNECPYEKDCYHDGISRHMVADALALLKEQEAKQYNNHEVACIIADLFGDPCACNFNDIDTWLPYKCDFRETCCPNPVGVACWEQYLKHK